MTDRRRETTNHYAGQWPAAALRGERLEIREVTRAYGDGKWVDRDSNPLRRAPGWMGRATSLST